jgi:ribosomal protein S18 acetylase RimI-like enzyme
MESFTSNYTSTIASYVARSAAIGKERGLNVEINAPFLKLRRRRSSAALTFHLTHIVLEDLEVEPSDRNKHYGSAMLDDVIAIGEALGLRIDLIAESTTHPDGRGLIQSSLENWYRRHEFVRADDALMRRVPGAHSGR